MKSIALSLSLLNALAGFHIFLFIERVAETLACLSNFLLNLLFVFCNLILDQYIGTIALLRVTVVDERVVECVNVAAGLPYCWVHKDG